VSCANSTRNLDRLEKRNEERKKPATRIIIYWTRHPHLYDGEKCTYMCTDEAITIFLARMTQHLRRTSISPVPVLTGDAYFTDSFTPVPLPSFHVPSRANTTLREQIWRQIILWG